jgi:hypothetical protein
MKHPDHMYKCFISAISKQGMTLLQSKGARWPVLFSAFSFSTSDPVQLATELVSAACFISHRQKDSREQVKGLVLSPFSFCIALIPAGNRFYHSVEERHLIFL